MNYRLKIIFLLLLISVLLTPWANLIRPRLTRLQINSQHLHPLADLPLDIDGNDELALAASSGNGSSGDPYIIQDKIINLGGAATDGIRIWNTTAHFILRNCTITYTNLNAFYAGISLRNVTNARLENNTVNNNDHGIVLRYSNNNVVSGNIANNNQEGIYLYRSNYNNLTGNTANKNSLLGIYLFESHNNTLTGNTAYFAYIGIALVLSHNNTLTGNTANNSTELGAGIRIDDSNYNNLTGNTAHNNDWAGIYIRGNYSNLTGNTATNNDYGIFIHGNYNNLMNNTANDNNKYGIRLSSSNRNNLTSNNATNNGDAGIYLAASNYNNVTGNTLHGNPHCIVEEDCTGNLRKNNDCSIPFRFPEWIIPSLGIAGFILFLMVVLVRARKHMGKYLEHTQKQ